MAQDLATDNKKDNQQAGANEAQILARALPYMQRYAGKTVVVKYGGHAMGDPDLGAAFCQDIALLKQAGVNPIVVHGGGPQIAAMLERLGIKSEFRDGLRITDEKTVEVVEMVLAGSINKQIVASLNAEGARAIGLCGKDGNMVLVEKAKRTVVDPDSNIEKVIDLGFVGEPKTVDTTVLDTVSAGNLIPVIAPVCFGEDGKTYNVNADTFAGAIAESLDAKRLLFLTDVPGVLDKDGNLIKKLSIAQARELIADGTISGGMIPKVETCISALGEGDEGGVEGVVILNGKTPHAVLLELFTVHGAGTLIVK
ncbi:MAG: acetylglutamate kinase [Hyphomicrobiales bacterium]|nr:MAG: acetylglutamate kinase [Hyphomicrobiales bacterium]